VATNCLAQTEVPTATKEICSELQFLDLKAQFSSIREEVLDAVTRVLDSQHFILGPEVQALESEIAEYVGAKFAVGCASGSDALLLALMALEVGPEDEVITTPFTFGATAGSIARLGARPVFVDIDPVTFNIDEKQIEKAITPKTRAIMPVHLFGLPAQMDAILGLARDRGLAVIEDAAQAIGALWKGQRIGSLGTFGCFSYFPSKNLGGAGDGGMVATNDPELAQRLKTLRVHGTKKKYYYELLGMNSRLDALQAAVLRVKLRHLGDWAEGRRRNANRYEVLFRGYCLEQVVTLPSTPETSFHVYNQYSIRVKRRDELQRHLREQNIPTEIYYPSPLHLQPAFANLGYRPGDFPTAESACGHVLALPIYPEITEEQQRAVVAAIAEFYARGGSGGH
jgi:dTDP-4-amino-4,6-dideoxygalactose transaminase